jgi:endoribonuclease Nob1
LAGFDPFKVNEEQVTVPNIEDEIKANSMTYTRFKTAIENGRVIVKKPTEASLVNVEKCATEVGDTFYLSETDKNLLALALEFRSSICEPQIVTDDYSIQNVGKRLGIEFVSLATFGIRRVLEWMRYCPACHKEYTANSKVKECVVCGTELKRKPRSHRKH